MKEYKIIFREDYARVIESGIYSQEDIIENISELRLSSHDKSSKKIDRQGSNILKYEFTNDDIKTEIIIGRKDKKANKEYIKSLEKWCEEDKKKKKAKIVKGLTTFAGASLIIGGYLLHHNSASSRLSVLTTETKIHGGCEISADGSVVDPSLPHGCAFGENKDKKTVEERIEDYCIKYDLGEDVEEAAKQKFDSYYKNEFNSGENIDLQKVYTKSKK